MSSSPPTESSHAESSQAESPPAESSYAGTAGTPTARWRSPAGWSLRARLVATLIGLLAVLGLVGGATMEIVLRNNLYDQLDEQLAATSEPAAFILNSQYGAPLGRPRGGRGLNPARNQPDDVLITLMEDTTVGGVLTYVGNGDSAFAPLSERARAQLAELPVDGSFVTLDLDGLTDYRLTARRAPPDAPPALAGAVIVTGLPTDRVQNILYSVAGIVGGVLLLLLVAAALVGAAIIRRTLRPLSRVAATATRVAELRLDHGDVHLATRVPDADTDPHTEVGQVGAALNNLLDHVHTALERRHASEQQVRQFVADASHELRTPLAAIRGYAELRRRSHTPLTAETAHVLRRVESEADRMTTLVEDLLLLARLDAGRPLAHDPVDLTALAVDTVSDAHAAGPRHRWKLDLPDTPVTTVGDPARLHQVLANLLTNARTHTPEGTTVTLAVGTLDTHAYLRVTDHGPGIDPGLLPHIFERFARGDTSRSRAAGSTGLGLSIVHAVVTAHHGTVTVESRPGHTTFAIELPLTGGDTGYDAGTAGPPADARPPGGDAPVRVPAPVRGAGAPGR